MTTKDNSQLVELAQYKQFPSGRLQITRAVQEGDSDPSGRQTSIRAVQDGDSAPLVRLLSTRAEQESDSALPLKDHQTSALITESFVNSSIVTQEPVTIPKTQNINHTPDVPISDTILR